MKSYKTATGYYILKDSEGRIGAKANVSAGEHPVPDWIDPALSFDVDTSNQLDDYSINEHYLDR